jgi:hypothetical protein
LVRAAVDGVTSLAGDNDGGEIDTLPVFIGNSLPFAGRDASSARCVDDVSSIRTICNICIKTFIRCVKSAT